MVINKGLKIRSFTIKNTNRDGKAAHYLMCIYT